MTSSVSVPQRFHHKACEYCCARELRCNEERPRCGHCSRLDLVCEYPEMLPTGYVLNGVDYGKDRTFNEIIETLDSIHQRLDEVNSRPSSRGLLSAKCFSAWTAADPKPNSTSTGYDQYVPNKSSIIKESPSQSFHTERLLSWAVLNSLLSCDLKQTLSWEGPKGSAAKWLYQVNEEFHQKLPTYNQNVIKSSPITHLGRSGGNVINYSKEAILSYSSAYFASFHCSYPILDRDNFYSEVLPGIPDKILDEESEASALLFSVLGLGMLAQEEAKDAFLIDPNPGRTTGSRGRTVTQPPGFSMIQEAQRRLGLLLTRRSLIVLQCCLHCAIYYSQISRFLDCWRMTEWSCRVCLDIITTHVATADHSASQSPTSQSWYSADDDPVVRSYWMCVLLESMFTTEFGLSRTGITNMEDNIPLPLFKKRYGPVSPGSDIDNIIRYHFLAQISLRKLLSRINESLRTINVLVTYDMPIQSGPVVLPNSVIQDLHLQLEQWRSSLPTQLQWSNDSPSQPSSQDKNCWYTLQTDVGTTYNIINPEIILMASLRTRYKYAQYLVWRPYLYKALISPSLTTYGELECIRNALEACSSFPLTLPFFQEQKRLLPYLVEYSHIYLEVLIVFHLSVCSTALQPVLDKNRGRLDFSTGLLIQWSRDLKSVDPVAHWCWQLIRIIYKNETGLADATA